MKRSLLVLVLASMTIGCTSATQIAEPATSPPPSVSTHDEVVMIFFDREKANLSDKAEDVVDRAAEIFVQNHLEREVVTGYCDSAEIARGDCEPLALRRATTVKSALARLGVPEGVIVTQISTDLLVPTPPNTHEPQNRRVVVEPH